jgi:hypothetical protein
LEAEDGVDAGILVQPGLAQFTLAHDGYGTCGKELVSVEQYSLGNSPTLVEIFQLAFATLEKASLLAVLTDRDAVVEGLCGRAGAGYASIFCDAGRRDQSVWGKISS